MMPAKGVIYDHDEFRRLWASGMSVVDIGKHFGVKHAWASIQAQKLGLPRRATAHKKLPIYAMKVAYENGKTGDEIAEELRSRFPTISGTTVRRILRASGDVSMRRGMKRGAPNAAECARLYRAGLSRPEIARRMRSTVERVSHAIRRVMGSGPRGGGVRVDVSTIRLLRSQGLSQIEIARRVGCHRMTVSRHLGASA
jgi:DNA-binding CsgD family transcriptional regulator